MGELHGRGFLCCFLGREEPLAKAMSADLLETETQDDLEVTLGLVRRQQWEGLERGNDQLWISQMCVDLQHLL